MCIKSFSLIVASATFLKLYYFITESSTQSSNTWNELYNEGKMTFCWPFSQYAGPKALTLSVRHSVLFAFDSDMIIASLPGFKVICYLSSEPKMFY